LDGTEEEVHSGDYVDRGKYGGTDAGLATSTSISKEVHPLIQEWKEKQFLLGRKICWGNHQ
jgi:hypothetical protein